MSEIGWLHLTDLHIGHGSVPSLLPNVKSEFFSDLAWLHEQSGPWHLLFFTGDLTQQGLPEEFRLLDEFLGELMEAVGRLGSKPLLLPVPGNHDLVRPLPGDPRVVALRNWDRHEVVRAAFWKSGSEYRALLDQVFANYVQWAASLAARQNSEWNDGAIPGDFRTRVGGLGVVGLNSAAFHLSDSFKAGALVLDVEQIRALFPDPPRWFSANRANVLLTHHPPEWLTKATQKAFAAEIAPAGRFALHLYGHMHEPGARWTSAGGGPVARRFQGASLFSVTGYRRKEERIHGYSAGRLTLEPELRLEIWPRRALVLQDGRRVVILDPSFDLNRSTQSFRDPPGPPMPGHRAASLSEPDLVLDGFPSQTLEARLAQGRRLRMLVMRSSHWFAAREEWLAQRIRDGKLDLEVIIPEPGNGTLMAQLRSMYDQVGPDELAQSIRGVIGRLLRMRSALPAGRKDALRIATHEYYPPYSAYLFDDSELWYIPYHRKPATLPVFVYRRNVQRLTVYRDFQALPVWQLGDDEWNSRLSTHARLRFDELRRDQPEFEARLERLGHAGAGLVVFGGFVRDAIHEFVHKQNLESRDLDLVVRGGIERDSDATPNHFGGTRWQLAGGLRVDCWELASTLAFARSLVTPATAENLTATTVYRLNGCYLDLSDGTVHGDEAIADIYSRRIAFNCTRYLDMYPEYQAFRALDCAERLHYQLDDQVKEFVSRTLRAAGPARFEKQVREHRPDLDSAYLRTLFERAGND